MSSSSSSRLSLQQEPLQKEKELNGEVAIHTEGASESQKLVVQDQKKATTPKDIAIAKDIASDPRITSLKSILTSLSLAY